MTVPLVSARARRVHRDAIVVDMHNDMITKVLDDHYDPDVRHPAGFATGEGQTDLPRLLMSGITAQFLAAWVDAPYGRIPGASYERAMEYVRAIDAFVARHPDHLLAARTAADVRRAKAEGKVAIFTALEGGHAIEGSLDRLREFHARGVRYLTLTWNNGTDWAGSSIGVGDTNTGGLTAFGREVIREMNRLRMLVDLSHVSEATFHDALAESMAPVVVSHSCARALHDHVRNVRDDQVRAVADGGGVVNVNFYARFLDPTFEESGRSGRPTPFGMLVDHVDHMVQVGGVDHVGLGSDFDGVSALPQGMEDVTCLPRLTQALLDRGYTDVDVRKILGGNMLRLLEVVLDEKGRPR